MLVGKFVQLIRRYGLLPTRNELMLDKRADASFPSHTVFTRMLGTTQAELAAKALDYCGRHPGFEDVGQICARRAAAPTQIEATSRRAEPILGAVYLFKSGRYYKIGRTNAAGRRERELVILMPEKGSTVHSISTDDPAGIEAYWHRRFEAKRKGGEWFDLDAADVQAFKRRQYR